MNVIIEIQVAEFHINKHVLGNFSDLNDFYNMLMAPTLAEVANSFDFIFDILYRQAGDMNQFSCTELFSQCPSQI